MTNPKIATSAASPPAANKCRYARATPIDLCTISSRRFIENVGTADVSLFRSRS